MTDLDNADPRDEPGGRLGVTASSFDSASDLSGLRSTLENAFASDETPVAASSVGAAPETAPAAAAHRATSEPQAAGALGEAPDQAPEAAAAARRMPASWAPDKQELWERLDPAVQDQVLNREEDFEKGLQEKAARYKPLEQIEPILAPRREQWQLRGVSAPQALQQLFAAQEFLERDPRAGIAWLARQYGVDPPALAPRPGDRGAAPNAAGPRPESGGDPLRMLEAQMQRTQAKIGDIETAEQRRQEQARIADVLAFGAGNPHFPTVRETMASLLSSGQAETLEDAYDKAVWLHPETRAKMIASRAHPSTGSGGAARSSPDAISKARRAAASVTGAPTGAVPAATPRNTLREELETHFQ